MKSKITIVKLFSVVVCLALLLSSVGCVSIDLTTLVGASTSNKVNDEYYFVDSNGNISTEPPTFGSGSNNDYDNNNSGNNYNDSNAGSNNSGSSSNNNDDDDFELPKNDYDAVEEVPETDVYSDGFENFGQAGAEITGAEVTGDAGVITVSDDKKVGNYSMQITRTPVVEGEAEGFTTFTFSVAGDKYDFQNWSKQKYISFWAKGDGTMISQVAFGYGNGDQNTQTPLAILQPDWTFYSYPIGNEVNLENVKYVYYTVQGEIENCWIDDLQITDEPIENYTTYIPIPDADVIETAEVYGEQEALDEVYKLIDAEGYSTEAALKLSSITAHSGDYSIKLVGEKSGTNNKVGYYANLGYVKDIAENEKGTIWIKSDYISEQKVYIDFYYMGSIVASETVDVVSSKEWKPYDILNSEKKTATFDAIAISTKVNGERAIWFDDFTISEVPVSSAQLAWADGNYMATHNNENGEEQIYTFGETFETPKDLHGSDGTIVLEHVPYDGAIYYVTLQIFTENKDSVIWESGAIEFKRTVTHIIKLEDLGLTDDDLRAVTGWSLTADYDPLPEADQEAWDDTYYNVHILVPRGPAPKQTEMLVEGSTTFESNMGVPHNVGDTIEEQFDEPINLSGSDGRIQVEHSTNVEGRYAFDLWIWTENGKEALWSWGDENSKVTSDTSTVYIPFEDLKMAEDGDRLTDKDLEKVTGYKIVVYSYVEGEITYNGKVTVPRKGYSPNFLIAEGSTTFNGNSGTPVGGSAGDVIKATYKGGLDLAGSDGIIKMEHSATAEGVYSFNLKLITENGDREWNWNGASTTVTNDTTTVTAILEDLGITEEDLEVITAYELTVYTDFGSDIETTYDYKLTVPRKVWNYNSVLIDEQTVTFAGNTEKVIEKTFAEGVDYSDSNGTLLLAYEADTTGSYSFKLEVECQNGEMGASGEWTWSESLRGENVFANTPTTITIPLADLGLTDRDLESVVSYKLTIATAATSADDISCKIKLTAPRSGTNGNYLVSEGSVTYTGSYGYFTGKNTTVTGSLSDLSGSNGTIRIVQTTNVEAAYLFDLTINTDNGAKTWNFASGDGWHDSPNLEAGVTKVIILDLAELLASDNDLSSAKSFTLRFDAWSGSKITYDYSVTIPRAAE